MKILFVNRFYAPDHSATSQLLTDLATALAAEGREVHVVTSRLLYDDPSARLAARELRDGVMIHRIPTTRFGRGSLPGRAVDYASFHASAAWTVFGLARRGDIVVAKTDPPLLSVAVGWAACLRGARRVNWLQDLFPEAATALRVRGTRHLSRLLTWLRDRSLHGATNVVLGARMRERIRARGVPDTSIAVIPNWADGRALHHVAHAENPLRAGWTLDGAFVVGYSGNMGRAHEIRSILDAAEALRDEPDIRFLFIGGGAQSAGVEVAARGNPAIQFRPYQPRAHLAQSLGAADVHIVTLRPELEDAIVPSKFYGVVAAARPVIFIGAADGEIGRLVVEAECGVVIAPGAPAELAGAIRALRDDPELRVRLGRNARLLFETRFDQPIAIAKWRAVLDEASR